MPAPTREQILADPNVQAILRDPRYTSPMLRDAAVNNYLENDPRSPFRAAMTDMRSDGTPQNGYHYNTQTGGIDKTNLYGHPGTMRAVGLGSVAAGGALASLGLLPGMGGASAAGGGTGAAAGGALPATVPGSAASSLYASGGFGAPGGTAAGVAAGAGGLAAAGDVANTIPVGGLRPTSGGNGGGGGNAGNALLSQLTSGQGLAGLAGLLTTLATRPNNGSGGSGDLMSQNPQLQHLLDMSANRAERTDPLHQAITQLAMSRLPTNVQR